LEYFIANGVGSSDIVDGKLLVYDGEANNRLYDPLYLAVKPKHSGGSSSGGCDAGLGAFALLGLAGAVFLRKKD
jgi:Synergist-CTERM protein sorting domain-containing protein